MVLTLWKLFCGGLLANRFFQALWTCKNYTQGGTYLHLLGTYLLVAFFVGQHNSHLPHSAFRGQTNVSDRCT